MANQIAGTVPDGGVVAQKLDAIGWGAFFVWVGVALLANLSWGIGMLGVGIIVLGMQAVGKYMALTLDIFWLLVGALFVVAGVWALLSVRISLIPIICIAAGVLLLGSALFGWRKK